MKIQNENQLLDAGYRASIIDEIIGSENKLRKDEAFKRWEVLKDQTEIYVKGLLRKQFDQHTVEEMDYAVMNLSFTRKVVEKLSRVYNFGVKRTMRKKGDTKQVEEIALHLSLNQRMKKANKYLKLFKNTMVYVKPVPTLVGVPEEDQEFDISVQALPPFNYDVIEHPGNPEEPFVVILSHYSPRSRGDLHTQGDPATVTRTGVGTTKPIVPNDGKDQGIADDPRDQGADDNVFIWWSPNFHFKTDDKGQLVTKRTDNPIEELPFCNLAIDQDGAFWAMGGKDLADTGIRVNSILSHVNHIGVTQGYGQLVLTGGGIPKSIKTGPNHAIVIAPPEDSSVPVGSASFISASPPINELLGLAEQIVALWLSTNNLSTTGFTSKLDGTTGSLSGISSLIDKAESVEDTEEQQAAFLECEPVIMRKFKKWHDVLGAEDMLTEDLDDISVPEKIEEDLMILFGSAKPIISEKDKLEVIEKRRDLGLNTEIELIMLDNPILTEKEATDKLLAIKEEKMAKMLEQKEIFGNAETPNEEETEEEEVDVEDDTKQGDRS